MEDRALAEAKAKQRRLERLQKEEDDEYLDKLRNPDTNRTRRAAARQNNRNVRSRRPMKATTELV